MEQLLRERLHNLKTEYDNLIPNLQAMTAAVQTMQQAEMELYAAQAVSPSSTGPGLNYGDIPEGIPSGLNSPWNPTPNLPNTASLYAPSTFAATMPSTGSHQGTYMRGRSSSMLSNVSRLTESSGEGPYWVSEDKMTGIDDRKDSSGSGSMSGSGSGAGSVQGRSPIGNGKGKMPASWPTWDEK